MTDLHTREKTHYTPRSVLAGVRASFTPVLDASIVDLYQNPEFDLSGFPSAPTFDEYAVKMGLDDSVRNHPVIVLYAGHHDGFADLYNRALRANDIPGLIEFQRMYHGFHSVLFNQVKD